MLVLADSWKKILSPEVFSKIIDRCIQILFNWKLHQVSDEDKVMFYSHLYTTMAVKCVHHWFQMLSSGHFEYYNAGKGIGDVYIPNYQLDRITSQVVLIYGEQDKLSDIKWVMSQIRLCRSHSIAPYAHLDFLIASDTPELVFPILREELGTVSALGIDATSTSVREEEESRPMTELIELTAKHENQQRTQFFTYA